MKKKLSFFIAMAIIMVGCSNDASLKKRAYELAHTYIITAQSIPR